MQPVASVKLAQVRDFGQIITDTFRFLRLHWRVLLRALATICLPPVLLAGFLMGKTMGDLQGMTMRPVFVEDEFVGGVFSNMLLIFLGYAVLIAAYMLMIAVVYEFMRACHHGEEHMMDTGELWRRAKGQVVNYLGIAFLRGLLIVLGFVLCVVPGIYAMVVLSLAFTAQAIERSGVVNAMARSNELIKDHWWETFGLVIIVGLIQSLIAYAVMIPLTIIQMVVMFNSVLDANGLEGGGLPTWYSAFMAFMVVVQFGVGILTYPIVAVSLGMKFFSLREEREGHGLQERISGFDQA